MDLKWKVQNGKKYLWDTFANRWTYRGDITSAVPDGEYKNEIPFPEGTRDYNEQKMSIANLVGGAADAAIKGVAGAGEYVSKGIGKYGQALAEAVAQPVERAVKGQFPEREPNTIYAPTASERLVGGIMAAAHVPQAVQPTAPTAPAPVAGAPAEAPVAPAPIAPTAPAPVPPPAPIAKVAPEMPEGMSPEHYRIALEKGLDPKMFQESMMRENTASIERSRAREEMYARNPWMRPGYGKDLIEARDYAKKVEAAKAKGSLEAKQDLAKIEREAEAKVAGENKQKEAAYWAAKNKPQLDMSSFPSNRPKYVAEEEASRMTTEDYNTEYNKRYQAAMAGKYQPYTSSSTKSSY